MRLNTKIAVLAGGISGERDVSLRSGKNVIAALQRLGYQNAFLFDIKPDDNNPNAAIKSLIELAQIKSSNGIELAFLVTHGTFGEDGCLQGALELMGIPYIGSEVVASANCMDKLFAKDILNANDLPTLPAWYESLPEKEALNGSFIVKPRNSGSSVGVARLESLSEFKTNDDLSNKYPNSFLEPFLKGKEVTASILEFSPSFLKSNTTLANKIKKILADTKINNTFVESNILSLPLLELRPKKNFYDYEAKYTAGMTEFILPAELTPETRDLVHKLAIDAFNALGCKGFARVDFIIPEKNSITSKPQILELNTLPGFTDTSDMPAQAKAAGITYDELVEIILLNQ